MKKISTLFSVLLAAMVSQAQIVINATDVPLPTTVNLLEFSSATQLSNGTNQNWVVSSLTPVGPTTITYVPETVPYWLGLGADIYRANSKNLTSSLVYNIFLELDKSTSGFNEIGFNVPAQAYSISSFTGNPADSLIIPEQDITYSTPKTIIPFPFTSTSSFSNSGRRVVAFTMNAPALGLNNTSFTHVMNEVRKDSVIGWGTMRVYTPSGASAPYDVLMDQIVNYSLDSFYMAGSPAPAPILSAFGVTQGQKVTANNAINFYRKGYYSYLFRLYYGADNTFTTITNAFATTDGVAPLGIQNHEEQSYQTLVYPNPCNSGSLNVQLVGKTISEPTVVITDLLGHIIQEQQLNGQANGLLQIPINAAIKSGNYTLRITDKMNNMVVQELITIQH